MGLFNLMKGERLLNIIITGALTACAAKPTEPVRKVVHVKACVETGLVDGACNSPDDEPFDIDVSIKDMQGDPIAATRTSNGHATFEFDAPQYQLLDLAYPKREVHASSTAYLCPTPNITFSEDGTVVEAEIAYSPCTAPEPQHEV